MLWWKEITGGMLLQAKAWINSRACSFIFICPVLKKQEFSLRLNILSHFPELFLCIGFFRNGFITSIRSRVLLWYIFHRIFFRQPATSRFQADRPSSLFILWRAGAAAPLRSWHCSATGKCRLMFFVSLRKRPGFRRLFRKIPFRNSVYENTLFLHEIDPAHPPDSQSGPDLSMDLFRRDIVQRISRKSP